MGRGARIRVATVIDAPPDRVWADVKDLASHAQWMQDAVSIRFTSPSHAGVGTTFDCHTRIGPFRLTDRMEITQWEDERLIGIRHVGAVSGEGRFLLKPRRGGRTRFIWIERLHFPWWMGGFVGAAAAKPILRRIWRGNLRNLAARF